MDEYTFSKIAEQAFNEEIQKIAKEKIDYKDVRDRTVMEKLKGGGLVTDSVDVDPDGTLTKYRHNRLGKKQDYTQKGTQSVLTNGKIGTRFRPTTSSETAKIPFTDKKFVIPGSTSGYKDPSTFTMMKNLDHVERLGRVADVVGPMLD